MYGAEERRRQSRKNGERTRERCKNNKWQNREICTAKLLGGLTFHFVALGVARDSWLSRGLISLVSVC